MSEFPAQLHAEIEKYERKHAENPEGRHFVPLANAYRKVGELELAEGLLREGLRLHPEYLSAHIVLGRTLADRGAAEEAAAEFRHVLSIDPQNLIALRTLGELAAGDGRREEAGYWYRELLTVDPMNDEARVALQGLRAEAREAEGGAEEAFQASSGWWESPADAAEAERGPGGAAEPWPDVQPVEDEDDDAALDRGEPMRRQESDPAPWGGEWLAGLDEADHAPDETDGAERPEPIVEAQGPAELMDEEVTPAVAGGVAGTEAALAEEFAAFDEIREEDHDELASRTLAELYAAQGFVDEAADMYRELIRRGGEEPELVRRLRELEGSDTPVDVSLPELQPQTRETHPPEAAFDGEFLPPAEAETGAERDTFADSFAHGFGGEPGVDDAAPRAAVPPPPSSAATLPAAAEPEERAEVADDDPAPARPTIAAFLGALVRWSPAAGADGAAPAAAAEASDTPGDAGADWSEPPREVAPEALADDEPGVFVAPDEPFDPPAELDPIPLGDDEPFPWELPAATAPTPAQTPAPDAPLAQPAEVGADTRSEGDRPEPFATPSPAEPPSSAPPAQDDDDLESFQAWLRSLKR